MQFGHRFFRILRLISWIWFVAEKAIQFYPNGSIKAKKNILIEDTTTLNQYFPNFVS